MALPITENNNGIYGGSPECAGVTPEASRCVGSSSGMSIVPDEDQSSLLTLPEIPMRTLLGCLPSRDILVIAKTCKFFNQVITSEHLLARRWFATLAEHQQNQFKEIARCISDHDLLNWLEQFTTNTTAADELLSQFLPEQTTDDGLKTGEAQKNKYFPHALFYKVGQLMAGCQQFDPVLEKRIIIEKPEVIDVSFSTHGNHLVIFRSSNTGTILGCTGNGQWNEQAGFSYRSWCTPEEPASTAPMTSFIARGRHVLTWDDRHTAKIFAYKPDHSCTEQLTLVHEDRIISADLSYDGHQAVITCNDGSIKIHRWNDTGHWTLTADIADDTCWKACFSSDGSQVLARPLSPRPPGPCAKILSQNEEGGWTSETIGDPSAKLVRFSPNGNPLLMFGSREMAKILRLNKKDGITMESIKLDNDDYRITHATASPDGRHVFTVNQTPGTRSKTLTIFSHDGNGNWIGKTDHIPILEHDHPILYPQFSPDSCHVMAREDLCSVAILSHDKHGNWIHNSISDPFWKTIGKTFFSPDSSHVTVIPNGYRARCYIYGYNGAKGWIEKATISPNHDWGLLHIKASFSADSRHIVSFCCNEKNLNTEYQAEIYGRDEHGNWRPRATITHNGPINSARFNAHASLLVTASADGTAIILGRNTEGDWEKKTVLKHADPVQYANFSVDSRQVVTVSGNYTVEIWRLVATGMSLDETMQIESSP
ncbi:hypothetical protein J7438_18770 [Thalassotalea sp. G20_0]|uniref:WD40 repeat domain-containing protein n=1 Tax=Thalassotalea sp. G20_0 TaxID=2821093 RepID=UPI001ADD0879|nr:WD40 repeat domain-containing protein [Thalassotalea sp. G20_0]MBO9496109.1 hypothetical protein [Thalassotalea sp. G20_0]